LEEASEVFTRSKEIDGWLRRSHGEEAAAQIVSLGLEVSDGHRAKRTEGHCKGRPSKMPVGGIDSGANDGFKRVDRGDPGDGTRKQGKSMSLE
jgi:hypothetical protein